MKIVRYQPINGPEVARLHRLALPNGFLSHLGDGFLSELYRAINLDSGSWVWVALDDAQSVMGFLSGTTNVKRCYRNVLWKHWPRLLWKLLPSLGSRRTVQRLVETLLYPFRSSSAERAASEARLLPAELLSVAVAEGARGQSVGRRLVDAFEESLRDIGYTGQYRVVTDASDANSNAFYSALGFRYAGSFRHHEHLMSVYTKSTGSDAEPAAAKDQR